MIYDFHTHTFLSDGELTPIELIRRALVQGYRAIAVADHVSSSNSLQVIESIKRDCDLANANWPILAVPAVELTHVPSNAIPWLAKAAKKNGAAIVVVHGETPVEPVEEGTNIAAIECPDVDILAHPGFLTYEEAQLAAEKGTFIEITARKGHSLTNGHVAKVAALARARVIVNSDAHCPEDLLTEELARRVALGCGLEEDDLEQVLTINPEDLLRRAGLRIPVRS